MVGLYAECRLEIACCPFVLLPPEQDISTTAVEDSCLALRDASDPEERVIVGQSERQATEPFERDGPPLEGLGA
jgi:hypothetical protein